jgi:hypothetical protein
MNTLAVLQVQTGVVAGAILVSLLMVASIIGYITSWLYSRSIYKKELETVSSDKHELNNRIVNLDGIIVDLKKISSKNRMN